MILTLEFLQLLFWIFIGSFFGDTLPPATPALPTRTHSREQPTRSPHLHPPCTPRAHASRVPRLSGSAAALPAAMNLFVGVIVENFNKISKEADGSAVRRIYLLLIFFGRADGLVVRRL